MSDIEAFVKNLKLKEVLVGGFEKEAVYAAMKELAAMYQKEIAQLHTENTELQKNYDTAASQLSQANNEIQVLKYQLEEGQKGQNQCEQKFNAFSLAIAAVNADKEKIINQAKKDAEKIIAEAMAKYESTNQECLARKQKMEAIAANISDVKQRFSITVESIHSILSHLLSVVEEAQRGGIEQQSDGEDEMIRLIEEMAGSVSQNDSREQDN